MADYLFVGAPTESGATKSSTFKTLRDRTMSLADVFELKVPDTMKIGTQDALVHCVEELHKIDTMAEQVALVFLIPDRLCVCHSFFARARFIFVFMILHLCASLNMPQVLFRFEKEYKNLEPHFDVQLDGTNLQNYICNFVWNNERFSTKHHNAQGLLNLFKTEITDKDRVIKQVAAEYNGFRQVLDGLSRKGSGTLQSRSLAEVVRKEDIIPTSEYLVAVFVVVSSSDAKKFEQEYDTLTNFVVPDSQKKICTEGDFILYRVVLFRNVLKEYKDKARELKWLLREYEHSDARKADEQKELSNAKQQTEIAKSKLTTRLKAEYPDTFIIIAHLKALRVYCESILRFGMPQSSQFCTTVVLVKRGKFEELRRTLNDMYKHLADDAFIASEEELVANAEIHPYVSYALNVHGPEFRDL